MTRRRTPHPDSVAALRTLLGATPVPADLDAVLPADRCPFRGPTVWCYVKAESRSGASTWIVPYVVHPDGGVSHIGYHAARVLGRRFRADAVKSTAVGEDPVHEMVYSLSQEVYRGIVPIDVAGRVLSARRV